ncbi:MAG TPA: flagellar biosynthetic protein FliO [Polyangiaceae bacterium]|nr:flagellar biosynthetic protein FliO [Polyangiaceae bacterium]
MRAVLDAGLTSGLLSTLQAVSALVLVAMLVWLGRRVLMATQAGRRGSSHMLIEERLALDLKSALLIVRVGDRRLLLATGDGAARLLIELSGEPLAPTPSAVARSAAPPSRPEQS